jgi:two-component system, sensor histidine kinase LadS
MALFSLLFQYSLNGIFRVLDMGLSPLLIFASGYITSGLFILAMLIFPILFFKTAGTMPWMHRILMVSAGCSVMMIIINITHLMGLFPDFWPTFMGGFLLLTAFLLILLGIRAIRLGLPGARYYLLGQGSYQMAIVLQWAAIRGWIRLTQATEYFIILATMLDIAFLSLALGARIKALSEEKTIYQALSMAQSRFTSTGKAIGAVIHQWKAPLSRLGTRITLMRTCLARTSPHDFAVQAARILPSMDRDLRDMGKTIDEFGLLYAGGGKKENFSPLEVINDVLDLLRGKITAGRITVTVAQADETLTLASYPRYLAHAITTLIDNAVDILTERQIVNGEIRIRLENHKSKIKISVEDNGGGISITPLSDVFTPFVSHKQAEGSGLGLPIAKAVTEERLGGVISVENTSRGARFTLVLPDLGGQYED